PLDGEAERVVDHAALRLVPAGEAGEDRQARRVRRCPARWPPMVRAAGPGAAAPGVPAAALLFQPAELVEPAGVAVEQQGGVVAAALDVYALRDRVTHAGSFVRV